MVITEENQEYYLQAFRVDFLTERWEREMYAGALMAADAWGKKIDSENKKYFSRNYLAEKYNIQSN